MDFSKFSEYMQETQTAFTEIQSKIDNIQVTKEVGGGVVQICVNGNKKILNIKIQNETLMHPDKKEILEELIVTAINVALSAVEEKIQQELQESTLGKLKNLPLGFMK